MVDTTGTTNDHNNNIIYNDMLFKVYYKNLLMRAIRTGREEIETRFIRAPDFPVRVYTLYRNRKVAINSNAQGTLFNVK